MRREPNGELVLETSYDQRVALNTLIAAMLGSDIVPPSYSRAEAEPFALLAEDINTNLTAGNELLQLDADAAATLIEAASLRSDEAVQAARRAVTLYAKSQGLVFSDAVRQMRSSTDSGLQAAALIATVSGSVLACSTLLQLAEN